MFLAPRLAVIAAAASAVVILIPRHPLAAVLLADSLVILAALADVAVAPDPRRFPRTRRHAPVVSVGREASVELVAVNPTRRRVRVGIRDAAAPSLRPEPPRLWRVAGPGTGSFRYTLRPQRRGRFVLGPVTVRTYGPLGIAGRQRTVDLRTSLKVYPTLRGREQVEGRLRRSRLLEAGMRSARVRGGGLEFDSLREYHPDDEFRRINWAATARSAKPITNVYREERNQHVLLVLDAGRTMAATVAGAPRFEHALDAAVAVASLAVEIGDRVGAFAFDQRVRASVPPSADDVQPGRIVDALFDVEPDLTAADYLGGIGAIVGRFRRRALVVLFTDLADEAAVDPLLAAIPVLVRRHLVLVAQVADPDVVQLTRLFPASADEAFLKAAAAAADDRRERAARRLAHLGADVVDRTPGQLASGLADAYLRAKAFGRL